MEPSCTRPLVVKAGWKLRPYHRCRGCQRRSRRRRANALWLLWCRYVVPGVGLWDRYDV